MADAPTYRIVLRPLPDRTDPQGWRRLRAALKSMLRSYRLRCVTFERVTPADIAAADAAERDNKEVSI